MSMLAEKRHKRRWSLNPRGNAWAKDSSKFGQKMLEKMGWKHGRGLGVNEDGIKEHIKISYKNDSKGMGFKEIEGWTEHEEQFSKFLKDLSNASHVEHNDLQLKSVSLEEVSQKSRVRVHYRKFTKSKDLSRYSEKDLANIFGRKSLTPHKDVSDAEKNEVFVQKGCMVDYFKKKLLNFSFHSNGSNDVEKEYEDLGSERCGFGYEDTSNIAVSCSQEINLNPDDEIENNEKCEKRKSEKKRRHKSNKNSHGEQNFLVEETKINDGEKNEGLQSTHENERIQDEEVQEEIEITKFEKKKQRKSYNIDLHNEVNQEQKIEENVKECRKNLKAKLKEEALKNTFVSYLENEKVDLKEKPEKVKSGKKKPRKNNNVDEDDQSYNEEENSLKIKSLKKKKRLEVSDSVDHIETNREMNVQQNSESENNSTKELRASKKEKKSKNKKLNCTNEAVTESNRVKLKAQRTEKLSDVDNLGISNPAFDPQFNNIIIEKHTLNTIMESEETFNEPENATPPTQTSKKKKNRSLTVNEDLNKEEEIAGFDNPSFKNCSEKNTIADVQENPYEVKAKEKKKKRKMERNDNDGIDNPTFSEFVTDVALNNAYEIKAKSKKRKLNDELAVDNPGFELEGQTNDLNDGKFEVKRRKNKKHERENDTLALDNPGFPPTATEYSDFENQIKQVTTDGEAKEESIDVDEELLLNVASLPVVDTTKKNELKVHTRKSLKHRKSVTFNDVVDQKIIPNCQNGSPPTQDTNQEGMDNAAYDRQANNMQENIAHISRTFDRYHAEVENDINEAKARKGCYIGEPGAPSEEHIKFEEGIRLSFKNVSFGRMPYWMRNQKSIVSAKKSYRHLIKGDIIIKFTDTNLHEITGYATAASRK